MGSSFAKEAKEIPGQADFKAALSASKDVKKVPVDPVLFQAPTGEERAFLQRHKDLITPSVQEASRARYTLIKRIYLAMPQFVRIIVTIVVMLILLVLLPLVVYGMILVMRSNYTEVISVIVLLFVLYWVWASFIRDV
jgi:hypothetical protein